MVVLVGSTFRATVDHNQVNSVAKEGQQNAVKNKEATGEQWQKALCWRQSAVQLSKISNGINGTATAVTRSVLSGRRSQVR